MRACRALLAATLLVATLPRIASAQLALASDENPVIYGHHHVVATNVDAHLKFWVEALGGTQAKVSVPVQVIRFPNVLVFLANREAKGGTEGTTVDHIGFKVKDVRASVAKLKAAGYPITTAKAAPQGANVQGDVATVGNVTIAFVVGPDGTKVELVEDKAVAGPPELHHLHFAGENPDEMQAWYAKTFGAKPVSMGEYRMANLPGVSLIFSKAAGAVTTTRDHALDHIGFEVRNLEEFCRRLEASGIKLDQAYTKVPAMGLAIAFFTDPWGTYIELTEGLDKIQ